MAHPKLDAQLADLLRPKLLPAEELVAAARVNYNGTIPPSVVTIDVAVQSVAPVDGADGAPDRDASAGVAFPTANQMALALTGGRLFVWGLGFTGKPKAFLGEVPLSAIVEVRFGEGRVAAQLELVMRSGARVDLEFPRGEPGEQFAAELGALVEG